MSFRTANKNWEGLAQKDAYWAVCTHPDKLGNKWDQAEFFQTGEREIQVIINELKKKGNFPIDHSRALDFGCGLGRLSRALSKYFEKVDGVDVSKTMIDKAKKLHENKKWSNIFFHHNENPDLSLFEDNAFSLVYTTIVLQHIPYPESGKYMIEFLRILKKDGILIFQIPIKDIRNLSFTQRLKSFLRIKERLALIGIGDGFNMEMNSISEEEISSILDKNRGELIEKLYTNHTDPAFNGAVEFLNEKEAKDFISALFIVRKA